MIEGVLRHDTEMDVEKQYVDTHGQSEVGFAFCHLLGFALLPRLKNLKEAALIPVVQWRAISQSSVDSDPADQLGNHRTAIRRTHQTEHGVTAWDS